MRRKKLCYLALLLVVLFSFIQTNELKAFAEPDGERIGNTDTYWKIDGDTLIISGTGEMAKFSNNIYPWINDIESIKKIVIKNGFTTIGPWAFRGCINASNIQIPQGVTKIGNGAFYGCTSLTSIELPEGVTLIGSQAFEGCTNLSSIEIPEGVTEIGDKVFYGCTSLANIELPEGVTEIGDR